MVMDRRTGRVYSPCMARYHLMQPLESAIGWYVCVLEEGHEESFHYGVICQRMGDTGYQLIGDRCHHGEPTTWTWREDERDRILGGPSDRPEVPAGD